MTNTYAFTMDYGRHYAPFIVDDETYIGTQEQAYAHAEARTEELRERFPRIEVLPVRRVSSRAGCGRTIPGGYCAELEGHKGMCRVPVFLA